MASKCLSSLLIGVALASIVGCTHVAPSGARHHTIVAADEVALGAGRGEAAREDDLIEVEGLVDLSEPPIVREEPVGLEEPHRFTPGVMSVDTELGSWVDEDGETPSLRVDLQNGCRADLDYAFAASDDPSEAPERRVLEAHVIQTQEFLEGHWLHLWDGERWLGAAVTTVDGGVMEIAASCDTLEVRFEHPERGPTAFAIHWELDVDELERQRGPERVVEAAEIVGDSGAAPEVWGGGGEAAGGRVELRLVNLCAEPADYAFTQAVDASPEASSTIPGHAERQVEVPEGWWLRYRVLDDAWRGGAATSYPGAVVWLSSNCVDYGIGDGEVVARGR